MIFRRCRFPGAFRAANEVSRRLVKVGRRRGFKRDKMILVGHVLDRLRDLPDNSVHCVVTSPPYWGLRDYGLPPIVWGGDSDCEHEFADELVKTEVGRGNWTQAVNGRGEIQPGGLDEKREPIRSTQVRGFCQRCNAWRGQLGLEPTPQLFVEHMVEIFREVRRVLRPDGILWLNIGDNYSTGGKIPPKNLVGMPWRVALALQDDGWILRNDHIWHKPNSMPESVRDRASRDHEYIFHFAKGTRYFFDQEAVKVKASINSHPRGGGVNPKSLDSGFATKQNASFAAAVNGLVESRNLRTVWKVSLHSFKGAHFATFPPKLVEPCIKAGTSEKGCCPHCGAPWRRLIEKVMVPTRPGTKTKVAGVNSRFFKSRDPSHKHEQDGKSRKHGISPGNRASQHESSPYNQHSGMIVGNRDPQRHITASQTVGWEKTCKCEDADPVPCTVLEPFLGSGTTAAVAEYLGRVWIGIELNESYADMARERIAAGYVPKKPRTRRPSKMTTQSDLF